MFQPLRHLAAAALVLGGTLAAQAQFKVIVTAPANLAGALPRYNLASFSTNPPAGSANWGFGDPNAVVAVRGQAVYALPDTSMCDPIPAGSLTGKIAIIRRSAYACTTATIPPPAANINARFGRRALKAQHAGAIGVLFIDVQEGLSNRIVSTIGASTVLSTSDSGAFVNIPVALISDSTYRRLAPSIAAGTCYLQMGTVTGQYPNNLTIKNTEVMGPQVFNLPFWMLTDSNALRFRPAMVVNNAGSAAVTSATYKCVINRLTPTFQQLYADSISGRALAAAAGTTLGIDSAPSTLAGGPLFKTFNLVTDTVLPSQRAAYKGKYEIIYTANVPGVVDSLPSDNIVHNYFNITDTAHAACRLSDDAEQQPLNRGGFIGGATGTGGVVRVNLFVVPPADQFYKATSLTYGAYVNSPATIDGESVYAEVNQWDDANSDSAITDDELTLLGQSVFDYTDNSQSAKYFTIPLIDQSSGEVGVNLLPGSKYLIGAHYAGSAPVTFYGDAVANTSFRDFTPGMSETSAAIIRNQRISIFAQDRYFILSSSAPSIKVGYQPYFVATKPRAGTVEALNAYPNPASSELRVSLTDRKGAGRAIFTITDLAGKPVQTETMTLAGRTSQFKISTASLANGSYQMNVRTEGGQRTIRFIVAH